MHLQDTSIAYAKQQDHNDVLKAYRNQFHIPKHTNGTPCIYLCGNSLGLQPIATAQAVQAVLHNWATLGVEGHVQGTQPWLPYHEALAAPMAHIVGALPTEVVVMNTLTVNLHLMLTSFYRPTPQRHKVLIEYNPFPSDRYAIASQIQLHGYNPAMSILEPKPAPNTSIIPTEHILELIHTQGHLIAVVLIGAVNYYSGQVYDIAAITKAAQAKGCIVGYDLAHAAGNIPLHLHNHGVDFAIWCTYKYLNSGPGSLGACYVHERHHTNAALPRLQGWWGTSKQKRFDMQDSFEPIPTVEAWQLSNPPILSMAAVKASLQVYEQAGMHNILAKSKKLTSYFIALLQHANLSNCTIITPLEPAQRGCQVSLQVPNRKLYQALTQLGVVVDWRAPDVIRMAPVPLYNTYEEVWQVVQWIKQYE